MDHTAGATETSLTRQFKKTIDFQKHRLEYLEAETAFRIATAERRHQELLEKIRADSYRKKEEITYKLERAQWRLEAEINRPITRLRQE